MTQKVYILTGTFEFDGTDVLKAFKTRAGAESAKAWHTEYGFNHEKWHAVYDWYTVVELPLLD